MGLAGVARNTLAAANVKRDWRIYVAFAQNVIVRGRRLYADQDLGLGLEQTVSAHDPTTIELCLWDPPRTGERVSTWVRGESPPRAAEGILRASPRRRMGNSTTPSLPLTRRGHDPSRSSRAVRTRWRSATGANRDRRPGGAGSVTRGRGSLPPC